MTDLNMTKLKHKYVAKVFDVHLGVADKYLLNRFYLEYEQELNIDVGRVTTLFLNSMSYKFRKLKQRVKELDEF